jgi:endoglucanase/chitinase
MRFAVLGSVSVAVALLWSGQPEAAALQVRAIPAATVPAATTSCTAGPVAAGRDRRAATLIPSGYLHTAGSQIVDEAGEPVRIVAVGWFTGFDDPAAEIRKMIPLGFNTVRISWVNATMQSDLQTIDKVVAAAGQHGMKVILDHHTDEAGTPADGYGAQQKNGLWYDRGPGTDDTNGAGVAGTVTQAKFLSDWVAVARRYAGNSTVIGFDLDNEPLAYRGQSTWGDGGVRDIRAMYQAVGNAILAVNPGALIIAEGPQNYATNFVGTAPAPYGDLSLAARYPVTLQIPDKVVYSVHHYPALQSGFKGTDHGPAAVRWMNADFGYLVKRNIAPVWVGEMGASMDTEAERAWASTLVDYLDGRLGDQGGPTFTPAQQGFSIDWWAWGNLEGEFPSGTLNRDGSPRQAQREVYGRLLQHPLCGAAAAAE